MQGKYKLKKTSGIKKIKKYSAGVKNTKNYSTPEDNPNLNTSKGGMNWGGLASIAGNAASSMGSEAKTGTDLNGNPIKKVYEKDASTAGIEQGIEGAASSIPVVGAFMAAGKGLHSGIRGEDEYGVAKSDNAAGAAAIFAPHKSTMRSFQEGRVGEGLLGLTGVGTFYAAGEQNKRDRIARDQAQNKEKRDFANSKIGTDLTAFQAKQYKTGVSKVKAPSLDSVSESTNTSAQPKRIGLTSQQSKKATSYEDAKRMTTVKNGLNALSYAKAIPTPLTQAIGWGASAGASAIDASEGNYIQAGLNLVPLKNTTGVIKGGTGFARMIAPHVGSASKVASVSNDVVDVATGTYSKGTKKTKVIEIEGKTTPEIHTDKNFNLKNLGTTPHSKGGNKVVAEEGDIVFSTQNSTKKYNEIIEAVMKKDKYKLKKEQAKLPEDKSPKKYRVGGTVDDETEEERLARESLTKQRASEVINPIKSGLSSVYKTTDEFLNASSEEQVKKRYKIKYGDALYEKKYGADAAKKADKGAAVNPKRAESTGTKSTTTTTKVVNTPLAKTGKVTATTPSYSTTGKIANPDAILNKHVGNKGHDVTVGRAGTGDIQTVQAQKQDTKNQYNPEANNAAIQGLKAGKFKVIKGKDSGNKDAAYPWDYYADDRGVNYQYHGENDKPKEAVKVEQAKVVTPETTKPTETLTPQAAPAKEGEQYKSKYNPLELASTAYNLGTGLFGNTEKVKRKEYDPKLEDYVDTSNNMRREVNTNYKVGQANARNLSGGSVANMRANSQVGANQKLNQVNAIDSQEYGKQLDVNNRNVDRINKAKGVNIDLFNTYEDQDAQNRAAKTNSLTTGIDQLSEIGGRSNLQRNALSNQKNTAELLKNNYGVTIDENGQAVGGTQFQKGTGPTYTTPNLFTTPAVKTKTPKKEKGSKSINVVRKYKLK